MNVQELINKLTDKELIPSPETTEVDFIYTSKDNVEKELEFWSSTTNLTNSGGFGLWFWDKN